MLTEDFSSILRERISSLKDGLPPLQPLPIMSTVFQEQERLGESMAHLLESLAAHFDQMDGAKQDQDSGIQFSEEELRGKLRNIHSVIHTPEHF